MAHIHHHAVIVGAGISGLALASMMRDQGQSVILLEKSDKVGGRMSRWSDAIDPRLSGEKGASTFSAPADHAVIRAGLESGALNPLSDIADSPRTTWYGLGGLQAWCETLADTLAVKTHQEVRGIKQHADHVEVVTQDNTWSAQTVVLTPPTVEWLDWFHPEAVEQPSWSKTVTYVQSLVLTATLSTAPSGTVPSVCRFETGPVASIIDNAALGISRLPSYSIHASPAFSSAYFEAEDSDIIDTLWPSILEWLPIDVDSCRVHRWRHGWANHRCSTSKPEQHGLPGFSRVFWAGDGFYGQGIAGALQAATTCCRELQPLLTESDHD